VRPKVGSCEPELRRDHLLGVVQREVGGEHLAVAEAGEPGQRPAEPLGDDVRAGTVLANELLGSLAEGVEVVHGR